MIRLNSLSKHFKGGFSGGTTALDQVSLDITAGEYVILVGVNGCGKSTLLQAIAGSIQPDSGTLLMDGVDITKVPEHRRSRAVARLFQNPLLGTAPGLSILENFRLASLRGNRKGLRIGIDRAFRDLVAQRIARLNMGLENRLDLEMGALSGGQRQALTLLMSTMDTCKVLLMDEPASALDPRSAELVMNLANEIVREKNLAALLVTHQLEDGVRYGDRILQMDQGKIIRDVSSIEKKNLDAASLRSWFNRSTD